MRKKDILGNFVKKPNVLYSHTPIRKLPWDHESYTTLITFLPKCSDLRVDCGGREMHLAGYGYKWLMYLPMDEYWCVTAIYSPSDELLEWYFDISRRNFIDECGVPCIDDVFLDLVILPDGEVITIDADELQEALDIGEISKEDFDNAYIVHDQIKNSKWSNIDYLKEISNKLLLEHELDDFPEIDTFVDIKPITKGWSEDKKYCVTKANGTKYLLRITPVSQYETRKSLYEMQKQVAALDVQMCVPVEFGTCNDGVYSLQSWICGEDLEVVLPMLSETEQYVLGLVSGEILRLMHSVPAPQTQEDWETRFNRKTDTIIEKYIECGQKFDGDEHIISYIERNRNLLKNRPQCFQHGDYHVGNMMLENGKLKIIDFDRCDFGDPWEEFNRIVWSATISPHFATGQIRGYFDGEPSIEFFKLMAFYIASNTLSSIYWAIPFGESEIDTIMKQSQDVLAWYDNMTNPLPTWYLKNFYIQWANDVPYKLKAPYDFSFLSKYGKAFKVFDDQDSGNICFGMASGDNKVFVKFAGAPTERSNTTRKEAINRMKSTAQIYNDLEHPNLTKLIIAEEIGDGFACVFDWADAECMGKMYPQSRKRFLQLSTEVKLQVFDDILAFHSHVVKQGYVAIDFYDGCIMYNSNKGRTIICDIEFYSKAPYKNKIGRMWGSSRFMSPEEFQLDAIIDEITNVYTMGATAFALFGDECDRCIEKWKLSKELFNVAKKAVNDERDNRQQTIGQFIAEWGRHG